MTSQSGSPSSGTLPPAARVHVLGAGPVGLVVTALLQSNDRFSVHLYEKRRDYSRTRMVRLAEYPVADSIESYCTDYIERESVAAIFESDEAQEKNTAYVHLDFLQRAAAQKAVGIVTEFIVKVHDPKDMERVAQAIDSEFAHDSEPTQTRSEKAFVARRACLRWLAR